MFLHLFNMWYFVMYLLKVKIILGYSVFKLVYFFFKIG